MQAVPCIILEISSRNSAVMALVENIQRQDLSFFDEASAIEKLITYYGMTQEDAAAKLGKAQSTIANKLLFGASPNELAELRVSCEANLDLSKIELVSADEQYLELLPNGVGKEQAMLRAADMLGIERDKIYAAGNYYNDVGMLDSARLSCTPEDARMRRISGNMREMSVEAFSPMPSTSSSAARSAANTASSEPNFSISRCAMGFVSCRGTA